MVFHRLPPAPSFVGREAELAELRRLWREGPRGVLALVGLGGAGKTAVAARFLDELLRPDSPLPQPEGLFVWSFYQAPDAGLFLRELHGYLAGSASTPARGAGLLHLLSEALRTGGPHLLILDGLERVQLQSGGPAGGYGQLEDPLLKALLIRLAEGLGQTTALVTSRFPLADVQPFEGRGYRHLDVGGLDRSSALALLRGHGVQGDDAALSHLIELYGAHALTLDHLGSLIGQFLGGDPRRAPELPATVSLAVDRQALRLARLLRAYEEHLPPAELALLRQLCLLRHGVTEEQVLQLFLCTPPIHARTVRELAGQLGRFLAAHDYPEEDRNDLAAALQSAVSEALCTATIAGPEERFRNELLLACSKAVELRGRDLETALSDLARLYHGAELDHRTDSRPLEPGDRQQLRDFYARYLELQEHPLMPYKDPPAALEAAFLNAGYAKKSRPPRDVDPAGVRQNLLYVLRRLEHLLLKHRALQRVRELCRLYQEKASLAGPLAVLEAADELRRVLAALVGRHLVLAEAGGTFSVHPAVRDHFHRLAAASAGETWHDIIREQLISLIERPGVRLPEDPAALDLVEEAIYHAQQAGRPAEAWKLYEDVLGGHRHLAWRLGEMARGLRIMRGFADCPDRWTLAWYLRALGELEQAYRHHALPFFRADIRLLQGRLAEVAAEGDTNRSAIAAFLMGRAPVPKEEPLAGALPRGKLLLYAGRVHDAERAVSLDQLYRDIGWEGERARCQLILAEVAYRQGDAARCRQRQDDAAGWILHSGSVEHLCWLHLVRAGAFQLEGEREAARRALDEGLHLASQCGLGLLHVELLCAQADLLLSDHQPAAAEASAVEARRLADGCQFRWGAIEAGCWLGQALLAQDKPGPARSVLEVTLDLCRQTADGASDRATSVKRLLANLQP